MVLGLWATATATFLYRFEAWSCCRGLFNGGARVTGIGEASNFIRSDNVIVQINGQSVRLRYVNCPFAPFLDTNDQNVCQGK